ncbi:uncharacterized protein BO95DRAFT_436213 [Aspergillus brunneoviolaceus CBS 621.78]|uniref:Uncharacterized protein n=1 Tax=Aspergillus brunneoviolaceus CBS 621.78 TaxID=1450534 RepID=A0ACD1FV81_9EURO|nr:hypothetical protein BO95DRAFT_436213 [Aspergillus brunneoviolaceus CBS 621.78]RAH40901.1 hypothetical protein BO95DRAFT_436213 [Aspergillus brunneoviolaceus CBS 621.78]
MRWLQTCSVTLFSGSHQQQPTSVDTHAPSAIRRANYFSALDLYRPLGPDYRGGKARSILECLAWSSSFFPIATATISMVAALSFAIAICLNELAEVNNRCSGGSRSSACQKPSAAIRDTSMGAEHYTVTATSVASSSCVLGLIIMPRRVRITRDCHSCGSPGVARVKALAALKSATKTRPSKTTFAASSTSGDHRQESAKSPKTKEPMARESADDGGKGRDESAGIPPLRDANLWPTPDVAQGEEKKKPQEKSDKSPVIRPPRQAASD